MVKIISIEKIIDFDLIGQKKGTGGSPFLSLENLKL
jgi:hypothetical protein